MSPQHAPSADARRARERALWAVAAAAVLVHLVARVWLLREGRLFACEDDPYRAYLAHLLATGHRVPGASYWLLGQLGLLGALEWAGVPTLMAGPLLSSASIVALTVGLVELVRGAVPADLRSGASAAVVILVAASPLTLLLGASALPEAVATALVVGAFAAWVRQMGGGGRWLLVAAGLTLACATWVRYAAWPAALAFPPLVYAAGRARREGRGRAAHDLLLALPAWYGPVAWLVFQGMVHRSPFGFALALDFAARVASGGGPSPVRVLESRVDAIVGWMPVTLVWALLAVWLERGRLRAHARVALVVWCLALPSLMEIAVGVELGTFPARFAYPLEIALVPLAAVAIASAVSRPRGGLVAIAVAGLTTVQVALGPWRPADMLDASSARAAWLLSRGAFERELRTGKLLVERITPRPPYGWAAIGVARGEWGRTLFGTRLADGWHFVDTTRDDEVGRVLPRDLPEYLADADVRAMWLVTPGARAEAHAAWPDAEVTVVGRGVLVARPASR